MGRESLQERPVLFLYLVPRLTAFTLPIRSSGKSASQQWLSEVVHCMATNPRCRKSRLPFYNCFVHQRERSRTRRRQKTSATARGLARVFIAHKGDATECLRTKARLLVTMHQLL